jgi:hypothetical protein
MFNRFKLLLVLITLSILGILFLQNQEPVSLRLLCGDPTTQYCWYQTPTQPLAVWMALFLSIGIVASLIWQALQHFSSKRRDRSANDFSPREAIRDRADSLPRQKTNYSREVFTTSTTDKAKIPNSSGSPSVSDWEASRQEDWESESQASPNVSSQVNSETTVRGSTFEVKQEPRNINQSGSTYSYQFKDSQKSNEPNRDNTDEVYDANYRTLNTPKYGERGKGSPASPGEHHQGRVDINNNTDPKDDDEDWI